MKLRIELATIGFVYFDRNESEAEDLDYVNPPDEIKESHLSKKEEEIADVKSDKLI